MDQSPEDELVAFLQEHRQKSAQTPQAPAQPVQSKSLVKRIKELWS